MDRRDFISILGTTALAAPVLGSALIACSGETKKFEGHVFPELPYTYNELEPYIDAQTMELHYDKHHRGYFNNFMKAIEGTELVSLPMNEIFAKITQYDASVRNNGGGYYNHWLFWENMCKQPTVPSGELQKALTDGFGSVDQFKDEFATAAKNIFGSGWAWLIRTTDGQLKITVTANQDNPLMNDSPLQGTPLLALDVWEHAYYLHYQNRRAEYVDNFWSLVNWQVVSQRFENA